MRSAGVSSSRLSAVAPCTCSSLASWICAPFAGKGRALTPQARACLGELALSHTRQRGYKIQDDAIQDDAACLGELALSHTRGCVNRGAACLGELAQDHEKIRTREDMFRRRRSTPQARAYERLRKQRSCPSRFTPYGGRTMHREAASTEGLPDGFEARRASHRWEICEAYK